ncbi:MAG: hypothetical protein HS099_03450 [Ardenticatenaceae bacterium]|nr:hypothetical protein [Ardenticatenaceae bacterium]
MSTSLNFDKMYELRDPLGNRALRLRSYEDWLDSETAGALFRGQLPEPPQLLRLYGYMGGQPMDFLWSAMIPIACISERVVELLSAHQLTGWSTYPAEVYDRKGNLLPDYHGFSITGRVGKRDRSRSQVVDVPLYKGSEKTHQVYKGFFFDESSWDGSDFCTVAGTYYMVVTQAVYNVFKRNKVNNVRLIRLTEVEIPVSLDKHIPQT